jgi:hypothetical protein
MAQINYEAVIARGDQIVNALFELKDWFFIKRSAENEDEYLLSSIVVVPRMEINEIQNFFLECHYRNFYSTENVQCQQISCPAGDAGRAGQLP